MASILILTHEFPPFRGGVATYVSELAAAAQRAGHTVTVAAPSYGSDRSEEDRRAFPFRVVRFRGAGFRPSGFAGLLWQTRRILAAEKADIVHAADLSFLMAMAFLRRFAPLRFIASVHGASSLSVDRSRLVRILGLRDLYECPERIIANSHFTRNILIGHYRRVAEENVVVAYLGVDPRWFAPADDAAIRSFRERFRIPGSKRVLLTVARLDERKGHRAVLEAIRLLPAAMKEGICYLITGAGDDHRYNDGLQSLARLAGAEVIFTGALGGDELHAAYHCASLFCMPGDATPPGAEGFGLTYLEAAAAGVPSVAYAIASAPEVIADGETGQLVPHNDIPALARTIGSLLGRPEELRRLGDNARRRAAAFTWDHCAAVTYPDPGAG